MNEMTNDAAVAWRYRRIDSDEGPSPWIPLDEAHVTTAKSMPNHEVEPLYSATTVAELRARVAELEAGARELRRAFIFRQAVVASAETPEKIDFADDKVWAAAEKVRELLEKSP